MENKKKKTKWIICAAIVLFLIGTFAYSRFIAPTNFQLTHITYKHSTIPAGFDGFKIAFISDFDLKTTDDLDYIEKCINKINKSECDMVIFGGDLYEKAKLFDEERLVSILKSLDVQKGKLAVLGENELKASTDACIQILESAGFEVMRNQAHYIYSNNDKITFVGLENNSDLDSLITEDMKSTFILSVIHQPDYFKKLQKTTTQLTLSAHSGGGFISLPFMGGIQKIDGAKTYVSGKTVINEHTLIISNGMGMGHDKTLRFNCNPEALIITLRTSN